MSRSHIHTLTPEDETDVNDFHPGRRRLLKMFGLGATASTAAMLQADPVLAATLGYDEKMGVSPATYRAPKGLAQNTAAKQTALDWIAAEQGAITRLSDEVWQHAELSLRESLAISVMRGSIAADRLREKTPKTRRRSRVCSGGSVSSI
ncbi:hypothetical protein [Streptomyces sp. TLI_55]|uniref:hypothetical protein n=1 Tax=Streptomyces sp. TLI_55 TaxID=1938861 RepID=UPI00211CCF0A|nr:hypothetical protein [Streptomyces sp. TLI_55]